MTSDRSWIFWWDIQLKPALAFPVFIANSWQNLTKLPTRYNHGVYCKSPQSDKSVKQIKSNTNATQIIKQLRDRAKNSAT